MAFVACREKMEKTWVGCPLVTADFGVLEGKMLIIQEAFGKSNCLHKMGNYSSLVNIIFNC